MYMWVWAIKDLNYLVILKMYVFVNCFFSFKIIHLNKKQVGNHIIKNNYQTNKTYILSLQVLRLYIIGYTNKIFKLF